MFSGLNGCIVFLKISSKIDFNKDLSLLVLTRLNCLYLIEIVNENICPYNILQQDFSLLGRDKLSPHHEGTLGQPEQPLSLFSARDHQFMVEVKFHPQGW